MAAKLDDLKIIGLGGATRKFRKTLMAQCRQGGRGCRIIAVKDTAKAVRNSGYVIAVQRGPKSVQVVSDEFSTKTAAEYVCWTKFKTWPPTRTLVKIRSAA